MEKINSTSTVFRARITPAEVRAKIAEDKAKLAGKESKINKVSEKLPQVGAEQPEAEESKKESKKRPPKEAKKKKEPTALEFPVSARINDYGFIGLKKRLLEALGWHKGMALKIDKNADGSATVRKA